MTSPE